VAVRFPADLPATSLVDDSVSSIWGDGKRTLIKAYMLSWRHRSEPVNHACIPSTYFPISPHYGKHRRAATEHRRCDGDESAADTRRRL